MSGGPSRLDRPALRLVHHHPGRLRLRSEAFEGEEAAARAREALLGSGVVTRVTHVEETGSLLVEYEPGRLTPDELVHLSAEAAGLRVDPGIPGRPRRTHGERFIAACRGWNHAVYEMTGFRAEPRTLLPVGVALLSGVFLVANKAQRMPRWDNLAYWSLSLFAMLHGPEIAASRAVSSQVEQAAPDAQGEPEPR